MTAALLRIIIFAIIGLAIAWGVRKIWRDWSSLFRKEEEDAKALRRARDLEERKRPDVIDLKRGDDGTFRPDREDHSDKRH